MADETTSASTTTLPPNDVGSKPKAPDPILPATEPVPEQTSATERLREFEDAELGEDTVRINGQIERGYGSRFRDLSEPKQRKHAALVSLIDSEQKLADAHAALIQADADHEQAETAVDAADEAIAADSKDGA